MRLFLLGAFSLALALCMTSCSPFVDVVDMSKVPASQRAAAAKVRLYPPGDLHTSNFKYIGPVEANSCKLLMWDKPASESDALDQLRYKALVAGANAVMDFSCTRSGTDPYGTNCWNSVQCGGTAIRLK
jgi:RcsF lipoprotein